RPAAGTPASTSVTTMTSAYPPYSFQISPDVQRSLRSMAVSAHRLACAELAGSCAMPSATEAITDAAHGLDQLAVLADLLAHGADVDVDVAVDHDRVIADDAREQVRAREHAA